MNSSFKVDPAISSTSIFVTELDLSRVYLKNDKETPWLILVPKRSNLIEWVDLTDSEQIVLTREISLVSRCLQKEFHPDKLNVANLGNMVKQLHIHVIARYEHDRAWPGPIWGIPTERTFSGEEIESVLQRLQTALVQKD